MLTEDPQTAAIALGDSMAYERLAKVYMGPIVTSELPESETAANMQ